MNRYNVARRFGGFRRRAVGYQAPATRRAPFRRGYPSLYSQGRFVRRNYASPVYRRRAGVYSRYARRYSYPYTRQYSYPMRNVGYYPARRFAYRPTRPAYRSPRAAAGVVRRRATAASTRPSYRRSGAAVSRGYRRGKSAAPYNRRSTRRSSTRGRVSTKRASSVRRTNRRRGVSPPKRDFSAGKYLMSWDNVSHNQFLKSLRQSYIEFGKLTPKQMRALQVAFAKRKSKRRLYPQVYRTGNEIDPIHLELLRLDGRDYQNIASSVGQQQCDLVKSLSEQLSSKGFLTYKQSRVAGSIINQMRNPRPAASTTSNAPAHTSSSA